jgi:hypothetical protein
MTRAEATVLGAAVAFAWAAAVSLVLAAAGVHEAAPYVSLLGLAALAPAARAERDRGSALVVLVAAAVGTLMYVPAYAYGSSDRDPGVYAATTYAIARTGSFYVDDPLAHVPGLEPTVDGQRLPGLHPHGHSDVLPGFFLTEPSLGATFERAGARRLMNPLAGIVAVAAFGLAVRRKAGTGAGVLTVLLVAGTMPQVWQAKVPGPELLAQLGVAGALLAATTRAYTRSGLLTAFVWLARPDGVLLALLGLVAGRRHAAYLRGLALGTPLALWQTYALAGDYATRNGIPPWPLLGAAAVAAWLAGPLALRVLRRHAFAIAVVLVAALLVRQWLAPEPPPLVAYRAVKGYEPYTLSRIAGLVTWPAIVLALLGVRAARRRAPLLLVPVLLAAPYLVHPRVSPDLMFWGRRFVPLLLPGIAMLAAYAVSRRRVLAILAAVAVVVPYTQSWPLRSHDEYGGGLAAARAAAEVSEPDAVYVWVRRREPCCDQAAYLFPGLVWLRHGRPGFTVLPEDAALQANLATHAGPVYVVADGPEPPFPGLAPVTRYQATLDVWERGGLDRPDRARQVAVDFTVWRYASTAAASTSALRATRQATTTDPPPSTRSR